MHNISMNTHILSAKLFFILDNAIFGVIKSSAIAPRAIFSSIIQRPSNEVFSVQHGDEAMPLIIHVSDFIFRRP